MKSVLITTLFMYAAAIFGGRAMKPLRVRDWAGSMALLYETGAGMWLLSTAIFALSAAGRCNSRDILSFTIASAFAAAAIHIFSKLTSKKTAPVRPASAAPAAGGKNIFDTLAPAVAAILSASILINITRCFMPPIDFDALSYHLAVPRQYLLAGKIIELPTILYSNFPLAAEMMFLPGLAVGAPASAALIHTIFGAMTAALIYAWMKNYYSTGPALLGAAIFYLTPLIGTVSPAAMVDLAVAFYSFCAATALMNPGGEQHAGRKRAAAALFAGAAASIKWSGAIVIFIALAYTAKTMLLDRNKNGAPEKRNPAAALAALAGLAGLAVLPAAPYLIKNYLLTGNPLYPALFSVFGGKDLDAESAALIIHGIREHARTGSTLANFLLAPWNMAMREGSFQGIISPVYICLVPLCALVRRNKAATFALGFALLYFPMWYFGLNLSLRLFIPALPMLAVAAAHAAAGLDELRLGKLSAAFAALVMCMGLGASLFGSAGLKEHLPVISGRISDDSFLATRISEYGAEKWINENAWPDDRVMLGEILVRGYRLNRPYVWGHPVFQARYRYDRMRGGDDLFTALRADHISLIIFRIDPTGPEGLIGQFGFFLDDNGKRVWREFLRDHARLVYKSNNATVFRVLF